MKAKFIVVSIAILVAVNVGSFAQEEKNITIVYSATPLEMQKIVKNGMEFTILRMNGCGVLAKEGKAEMPAKRFFVTIPYDSEITGFEVNAGDYTTIRNITVYPSQPPVLEGEARYFTINETFYSKNFFYPDKIVEIAHPITYYGMKLLPISIYPVQFNPYIREIKFYSSIKVRIEFDGEEEKKRVSFMEGGIYNEGMAHRWYEKRNMMEINEGFASKNLTDTNNSADYIIITHENFYNSILPLAEWKEWRGFDVMVVNVSQIYSQFPVGGASSIKAFISYAYHNWSGPPSYVLLVGDVEYLPTFSGLGGCATDLYFSSIDGNDYFPDLKVGRISVKTPGEMNTIVNKILGYEKTPYMNETAWYKNATVFYGTERPPWQQTANFIENLLTNYGYNVSKWNEYEGSTDRMAYEINTGRCFVSYREHGSVDGWYMAGNGGFYNDDVMALVNGRKLPVIFSTTCNTGWFDYSTMDCFGEVWMKKAGGGAIAFLGSSRPSYTGYNDELAKGFYKAMFNDSIYDFVGIMNQGKLYMYNYYGDGYYTQLEYEMYNSFTEPSLWIYTDVPHHMNVTYPDIIPVGDYTLLFNIKDEDGNAIEGATIVIKKEGEYFYKNVSDENGYAKFNVSSSSIGNISFVITAHNFIPYMGNISVISRFHLNLTQGWNLITIPYENSFNASSLYTFLSGCTAILAWNASSQDFIPYMQGSPYDFAIEDGHGYFVAMNNNFSINTTAIPLRNVSVTLLPGWNCLGWFKDEATTAKSILENITSCSTVLVWNASTHDFTVYINGGPYNPSICQGDGFFVAVSNESEWHGEG